METTKKTLVDKTEIIREVEKAIEGREGYYPLQVEVETEAFMYDLAITVSQKFGTEPGGDAGEELSTIEGRSVEVHSIMQTDADGRMVIDTPALKRIAEDIEHYFEI